MPVAPTQRTKALTVAYLPERLTSNSVLLAPGVKWISMPVMLGGNSTPSFG